MTNRTRPDAQALAERNEDTLAAAQFWQAICDEAFDGDWGSVEYDTFLDAATRCGLIAHMPYDPELHGDFGDAEPDTIYWPTERAMRLRALLPPTKEPTNGG